MTWSLHASCSLLITYSTMRCASMLHSLLARTNDTSYGICFSAIAVLLHNISNSLIAIPAKLWCQVQADLECLIISLGSVGCTSWTFPDALLIRSIIMHFYCMCRCTPQLSNMSSLPSHSSTMLGNSSNNTV